MAQQRSRKAGMNDEFPWVVIVLAAGRGTRMGGPKALMRLGGRLWWRVQEDRLAAARMESIWVVSDQVRMGMGACGSPMVRGKAETPMFSSILAGIEAAPEGRGVFVLPVDVPAPARGTFEALSRAARDGTAVPVCGGKRGHPAALSRAWIDRVFAPAARQSGELRLDELLAPGCIEVAVEDTAVVTNLNTPRDLEAWLASRHGADTSG